MTFKKLLDSFSYGRQQDCLTLYRLAKKEGVEFDQLMLYLEGLKKGSITCDVCLVSMLLFPVNTEPGNQVGGVWRSQWVCPVCSEGTFSEDSVEEVWRKHGES